MVSTRETLLSFIVAIVMGRVVFSDRRHDILLPQNNAQGVELLTHANIHTLIPVIFATFVFLFVALSHEISLARIIPHENIPATTVLAKRLSSGSLSPLLLGRHVTEDPILQGHDAVFEEIVHLVLQIRLIQVSEHNRRVVCVCV